MILIVPHGVDPCAAFLSLGLSPSFVTHSDHYAVTLPEGVSEAVFQAALLVAPAGVYLAAAKAQATAAIRSNAG